jgi:hypothetical protein
MNDSDNKDAVPLGTASLLLLVSEDYSRSDFFQLSRSPSVVLLEDDEEEDDPEPGPEWPWPEPFGVFSRSL